MTMAENGFAAFREPVDRRVFAPGFGLWLRVERRSSGFGGRCSICPTADRRPRPMTCRANSTAFPAFRRI